MLILHLRHLSKNQSFDDEPNGMDTYRNLAILIIQLLGGYNFLIELSNIQMIF